jgi:hypothetical protein
VPLIVRTVLTAGAVLATLSVNTVELLVLYGTNKAVTPLGRPMTAKLALPVNPFAGTIVTVELPVAPGAILRLVGDAVKAKYGAVVTVSASVVVWVKLPEVPVIVIVDVPEAAVLAAAIVNVVELVELVGLNEAVTPLGRPLAEKETAPANPLIGTTVTFEVPLAPGAMVRLAGEAVSE